MIISIFRLDLPIVVPSLHCSGEHQHQSTQSCRKGPSAPDVHRYRAEFSPVCPVYVAFPCRVKGFAVDERRRRDRVDQLPEHHRAELPGRRMPATTAACVEVMPV